MTTAVTTSRPLSLLTPLLWLWAALKSASTVYVRHAYARPWEQ